MDFKKILNITALVSAVLLMGVDVYYLSTLFSGSTGGQTFQAIMWTSTPCALLCGGTYLLYAGQKRAARPAAVCTLIVNAFYFLVRLFALILQITDVLNGRGFTFLCFRPLRTCFCLAGLPRRLRAKRPKPKHPAWLTGL